MRSKINLSAALALWLTPIVSGAVNFQVTFNDPGGTWSAYYAPIQSNLEAAGKWWARRLNGNANLEIVISFADIPTGNGGSMTSVFIGTSGPYDIFEQGAAYEVRTGIDPNGATPDIQMTLGYGYLTSNLWFDPDPYRRIAPIPSNRTDSVSVFLHELGHAFAINGWRDWTTGALPANYASPFDILVSPGGGYFYFNGAQSVGQYGGPVPLTYGNIFHFGNDAPAPGSNLILDLMNGVVFYYQHRYWISDLDLACFEDAGVSMRPACPADVNVDQFVGVPDLLAIINSWGQCLACWSDVNGDGFVGVPDLLAAINSWGMCPLGTSTLISTGLDEPHLTGPDVIPVSLPGSPLRK